MEIKRHKNFICKFIKQDHGEFDINFSSILEFVNLIKLKEYEPHLSKALKLVKNRDSSDADFLACASYIKADFIWSNDKDLKGQNLFPTRTTGNLLILENRLLLTRFLPILLN